ncbi:MAG: dehydrogenase [Clostridiales bacterium]|nr:dehydrogenase [Clostridiales bacterium]
MPQSQFYDPNVVRAKGELRIPTIPLNTYQKCVKDERNNFTDEEFINIFHDMQAIREFETMIFSVRTTKQYNGVDYVYTGPAHLYTGQEAAAVGMAYTLDLSDAIFGSHRSHGEVLARGYSAIRQLGDDELTKIMRTFNNGKTMAAVGTRSQGNVKKLAQDFLLYGFMAELFGRENGFTRGLGNSMHVFFAPFGIYPNNAIVGGSAGITVGAALYKKVMKQKGLVVCNIGDGALGCGPVWEAMNFASMEQFTKLWDDAHKGGLKLVFNFFNNGYGMGGQTDGETMAYGTLARVGAGINADAMHSERVDGYNPLAVIDAYRRKRKLLEEGKGPVLLDVVTYRYVGHSTTDASTYRTKEEIETWQAQDSIQAYRRQLIEAGVATDEELTAIEDGIKNDITEILKLSVDDAVSPRADLKQNPDAIRGFNFSNERIEVCAVGEPDVLIPLAENPRFVKNQKKARYAFDENGEAVSKIRQFNVRDALFEAIIHKFYQDPTLIAFGEDNRDWGGAFGVYGGLTESLPYHRFFNAPISEGTIVSSAVGYALMGGRAIPELMYCDFLGRAGDEVFNQLAKWQAMSAGALKMPVVLRVSVGNKYGAQHSQDWTSLAAHIPGLKVCFPVTPYDAKGMMNAALAGSDPVVFFESQKLYDKGEEFRREGVPEEYYEIPLGEPDIKRTGTDLTILSVGASLYPAMEAAKQLESFGVSAEVIDARSLVPFNYEPVNESVKKTGRIVLVSDACERGSHMNDMARNVTEFCFGWLDAPPVVVGASNGISPCPELEHYYYPQASWILSAVHQKILPLKGYVPEFNYQTLEKMRRERLGL